MTHGLNTLKKIAEGPLPSVFLKLPFLLPEIASSACLRKSIIFAHSGDAEQVKGKYISYVLSCVHGVSIYVYLLMERNARNAFQDLRQRHLYVSHLGFVHIKTHACIKVHMLSAITSTPIASQEIPSKNDLVFSQRIFPSFHMFLETNCHAVSVWHQGKVSVCPVMLTQLCLSPEYPAFKSDRWQLSNQTPAWWWRFPLEQARQPCRVESQDDRMKERSLRSHSKKTC